MAGRVAEWCLFSRKTSHAAGFTPRAGRLYCRANHEDLRAEVRHSLTGATTLNPLWNQLAAKAGLTLSDEQLRLLDQYLELLLAANQTMNLTRIVDRTHAEVAHIGDALTLLPHLPPEAHLLADVGSGGGVPGLVLAIARPDVQVTLIESTQKKAAFLSSAVQAMGLKNVTVLAERTEVIAHLPEYRDAFDVVTARAVALMNLLIEWCMPLARKGGKVLAMKGPKLAEELPAAAHAIKELNGGPAVVHTVGLPGGESHVIAEIPKLGRTNPRYPRTPAQAKQRPL